MPISPHPGSPCSLTMDSFQYKNNSWWEAKPASSKWMLGLAFHLATDKLQDAAVYREEIIGGTFVGTMPTYLTWKCWPGPGWTVHFLCTLTNRSGPNIGRLEGTQKVGHRCWKHWASNLLKDHVGPANLSSQLWQLPLKKILAVMTHLHVRAPPWFVQEASASALSVTHMCKLLHVCCTSKATRLDWLWTRPSFL